MLFRWRQRRPLCRARSAWLRKLDVSCHEASRHCGGGTCLMTQSTRLGAGASLLGPGTTRFRNSPASERLPAKPMQKRHLRRGRKPHHRHRKVPSLIGRATRFIPGSRVSTSRDTTTTIRSAAEVRLRRTSMFRSWWTDTRCVGGRVTASGPESQAQPNFSTQETGLSEHGEMKRLGKPRQRREAKYTMEATGGCTLSQHHRVAASQETHDDEQRVDIRGLGHRICR
jgi:hypothetical protein